MKRLWLDVAALAGALSCCVVVACSSEEARSGDAAADDGRYSADIGAYTDSDGDGLLDAAEVAIGTDPNDGDTDGDGYSDGDEVRFGSDPKSADSVPAGCQDITAQAEQSRRPVDIIVVVDQSSSMKQEIQGIEDFINDGFYEPIKHLDYRVILIALYGNSGLKSNKRVHRRVDGELEDFFGICIRPPLGGDSCLLPAGCEADQAPDSQCPDVDGDGVVDLLQRQPKNTDHFWHYDQAVDSKDGLLAIQATYSSPDRHGLMPNGWGDLLRPGSLKFFTVFSDDNSTMSASAFESWLFQQPQRFGSRSARTYVFHSIIGIKAKDGAASEQPYLATEAIVTDECESASNAGAAYQPLSKDSGGLRFPVCNDEVGSSIYEQLFDTLADTVIQGSEIACVYDLPPPPAGLKYDFDGVIMKYAPAPGQSARDIGYVDGERACGSDDELNYFVDEDVIKLCQQTCATVQTNETAQLKIHVSCDSGYELY